jgi:hypothetical protein
MSQMELFFPRNCAENCAQFGTACATLFYDVCTDVVRVEGRSVRVRSGHVR